MPTDSAACRACVAGDCQTCLNVYDDTIPCDCNHTPGTAAPTWRWFACCEDCGKAIVAEDEEAMRGTIALHKMEGCDE